MSEHFRRLVEQAPDGVVILDAGRVVFMNATAQRLLGVSAEQALGQSIAQFLPAADAQLAIERIITMMRTGEPTPPYEYGTLADPDRTVEIKSMRWEWQGRPAVLAFARDVSERKRMQQQLVRADRLAAVGTLAAGVAHEINNPLAYVQLSLQLIEQKLVRGGELAQVIADAQHGVDRIAAITHSLRMFARAGDEHARGVEPIDPVGALDRAVAMVHNDLRHRAQLVRRVAESPWVVANASQLEQVLVNLLLNAIQALQGKPEDTITVELAPRGTAEVVITIRDTGCGMAAAIRDRVFDPFFTTKPAGEGMGLGLAISKTIVDAFHGRLELESTEGAGTTAMVILRAHAGQRPAVVAHEATIGPRRRVLVVDDEDRVRLLLDTLLSEHHEVASAADGETALALVRDRDFEVILCDVMMPRMSGVEVYQQLRERGLERRVVFMTGGTFVAGVAEAITATGNPVLHKPFDLDAILQAIASV
jgi:PAS domain S-box-containing protein